MDILSLLKGKFHFKEDKLAYLTAMEDIRKYRKSLISCRVVGLTKTNFDIVTEDYVGLTKKKCIEIFKATNPDCFITYVKAFTQDEAERYFMYLKTLDSLILRYKSKQLNTL